LFFKFFPYYLRFCAARYIKLVISSAFERKLVYRIVWYRSVLLAARISRILNSAVVKHVSHVW